MDVFDVYYGKNASDGALFNGYYNKSGGGEGHFIIRDFKYDDATGLWKTMITAQLTKNNGQLVTGESSLYQFRLRLSNHDGIIAYAGGWASQANRQYDVEYNTGGNQPGGGGDQDEYLLMSLPCNITHDVQIGPGQPYELILFDLDQPGPLYPGSKPNKPFINNRMNINVAVFDETDRKEVVKYEGPNYNCDFNNPYDGSNCMGENGTLHVTMTMKPGHKYQVHIWRNWVNNLIEYHLPFDNISYATECDPKIDMRAAVDYIDEAGHKRASAQGKYDSQDNSKSNSEVYVFDQWGHNARTTWSDWRASPDPAIIRKEDAKVTPGKFLTWWFRAHNVSGYPTPDKTDFANFRTTFNGSTSGWDEMTVWPPRRATNWFQPSEKGGKLDRNHPQVTWGCNEWGTNCVDHYDWYNRGISFGESISYHYRYQVRADDAEKTLCQRVRNSWPVGQDWKERFTPWACAYVPYDYPPNQPPPGDGDKDNSGVVPTAKEEKGRTKVQAGDDVQFSYSLTNTSGPTVSRQIVYRPYTFILRRGAKLPLNAGQKPYHYAKDWGGNGVGCGGRDIAPGAQSLCKPGVFGTSGKIYPGQTWPVPEKPKYNVSKIWLAQPGDKICSYIAIDNNWSVKNDQSADTFRASNIACVVVTKSPNLNLSGSDSYAKDGFTGSDVRENIVPGTDKRGSYSQYGLLTGDEGVKDFGSAGYTTASVSNHGSACKLSYANTSSASVSCSNLSGLSPANLIKPDKGNLSTPKWPTSSTGLGPQVTIKQSMASGDYGRNGSLIITGGSLGKGRHIRLFVKGDVTINGDISADEVNPIHSSLSDIPSLTVVATGDIRVEREVSVIAGTYVAGGKFESCKDAQNQKKTPALGVNGVCQNKLKVNGAIVSEGSPAFLRTFGAGNMPEDDQWDTKKISSTAEWINYTPNLWLTTSNGSSGNQLEGLTTTQVTNLPVRY
ncbi:hypothetical protein HG443_003095 [Candidatus Saccharibacteria bacterium]|nr:hypothetical protein [Candidatus Saccharibacteria bacterium]